MLSPLPFLCPRRGVHAPRMHPHLRPWTAGFSSFGYGAHGLPAGLLCLNLCSCVALKMVDFEASENAKMCSSLQNKLVSNRPLRASELLKRATQVVLSKLPQSVPGPLTQKNSSHSRYFGEVEV